MGSPGSDNSGSASLCSSGSRKRSALSTNEGPNRSVVDFDTEDQLREALLSFLNEEDVSNQSCSTQLTSFISEIREGQLVQKVARTAELQTDLAKGMDWVLPAFDASTTNPQSLEDELKRLQVLKSYFVLDAKREEAFDRITQLASRIFGVPLSMVSLVDLGRQFFMSNHGFKAFGLEEARDFPRKFAFCSHAILNKDNILVVPDLTADFRFVNNPFVAGPPHVKFYAGAPLVSPEGFKLGTICILDLVARPHGLTPDEANTLVDLADMTVKVMIDRRFQLKKKKNEDPAKMIAYTAYDLMAPLTGVHTSLSILKNDASVKAGLGEQHFELLSTAAACSDLMIRICKNALNGIHLAGPASSTSPATNSQTAPLSINPLPLTNVQELVRSLQMTADPIPKKVPCIVTLEKTVPSVFVADDLKLFRCSVNLLTNAIDRTSSGIVHLSIKLDETVVLFECEDTGEDIPVDEYEFLFQPGHITGVSREGLSSIANLVDSLDGEYGFRPRGIDSDGNVMMDYKGLRRSGSIFWFSIPLILPEMVDQNVPTNNVPPAIERSIEPSIASHGYGNPLTTIPSEFDTRTNISAPPTASCSVPGVGSTCDDAIANFALAQGSLSESNPNMMDELTRLALELDASLADLEPLPLNSLLGNSSKDIRRRKALIIDDSVVVRRSLAQALNSLGFDVVQANDGTEGLKEMQQALFDLVLCDFLMPLMDGVICVREYRAWEKINRPWDSQLIVGISANPSINDNGQGLHAGMNAFLPKPITIKTLTDLQCSSEAVLRTRQLDEYEGNGYKAGFVGGRENEKSSTLGLGVSAPLNETLNSGNFLPSAGPGVLQTPACLIACSALTMPSNLLPHQLESAGWKVVVVNDGLYCLELLKMRSWTVALIEEELAQLSGFLCVAAFRKWEAMSRTNIPMSIILVCDGDIPPSNDRNSWIQAPNGFNGVLRKPVQLIDFQCLLLQLNSSNGTLGGSSSNRYRGQIDVNPNTGGSVYPQLYF